MSKIQAIITEKEYGKYEVQFKCNTDIWEWLKKKKNQTTKANVIFELVLDNEVKEFHYKAAMDKFLKSYEKWIDEII